jgi:hypothetical protein
MFFGINADNQDRQGRPQRFENAQDFESRHVRQIQVQDDEIPGACANVIDCMAGRGCFDNVGRQSVLNEEVP